MFRASVKILILTILIMAVVSGCSSNEDNLVQNTTESTAAETTSTETIEKTTEEAEVEKIRIVASLFPHYDFAKTIGGDYVDVSLILPPGIESHSFEPTPREIISIMDADLFIYTNDLMEPWAAALIKNVESGQATVIDLSKGIELLAFDEDHTHDDEDADGHGDEGEYDPHYWLDLGNAMIMIDSIRDALTGVNPELKGFFEENAEALKMEIAALDKAFFEMMNHVSSKTILSGGHFAFGYFASRYGLDHESPYYGFSPDAEPTPQNIAALIKSVKETGAQAIFFEELIEPRVAKIISEEANVEMLLLHAAHNISKDELASNITYVEIMRGNLERLKKGLGYNE